jgi:hypothetical protein
VKYVFQGCALDLDRNSIFTSALLLLLYLIFAFQIGLNVVLE